jgi:hypothetical protein
MQQVGNCGSDLLASVTSFSTDLMVPDEANTGNRPFPSPRQLLEHAAQVPVVDSIAQETSLLVVCRKGLH